MLTCILDSLVEHELECLVSTLRRDGILCLPTSTPIDVLHDTISKNIDVPIIIYGPDSLHVPYTDCPRLWLCCGPRVQDDIAHATQYFSPLSNDDLVRRERAMCCDYLRVTHVDALVFMADTVAKQCVHSMGVGGKAAEIILRHVKKSF